MSDGPNHILAHSQCDHRVVTRKQGGVILNGIYGLLHPTVPKDKGLMTRERELPVYTRIMSKRSCVRAPLHRHAPYTPKGSSSWPFLSWSSRRSSANRTTAAFATCR